MEYSDLKGGLARMLDRLQAEGTATKDREADAFLAENANAAVIGLLLDQRVLAETAFTGPTKLKKRLGHFDMHKIADMEPGAFQAVFAESPAVHRFTSVMADRVQQVARVLAGEYDGDASNMWKDTSNASVVESRIRQLPGFGPLKTRKIRFVLHYFGHKTLS